jgi:hypothetical protein
LRRVSAVFAVAAVGLALAIQGWRARLPNFDLLPYVDEASALLAAGRIPEKGTLTSFASYTPPGTAWLMAPGIALMEDSRLYESVGSAILYLGTIWGVFALAAQCAPPRFALLAAILWGLSESGLFFAHSLWPRGHPFFFVWMIYFTMQWVRRRNQWYLAGALITWAAGMFVFMEIAPAIMILPAVWWCYRPPLTVSSVTVAGVLALLLWMPYLRFQVDRDFVDLRSQLLRQNIYPQSNTGWCDPSLMPKEWHEAPPYEPGAVRGAVMAISARLKAAPAMAFVNFQSALPLVWLVPAAVVMATLLGVVVSAAPAIDRRLFSIAALLLIIFPLVVNEWTMSRLASADGTLDAGNLRTLRLYGAASLIAGAGLLAFSGPIHVTLERLKGLLRGAPAFENVKLLALCLALPWAGVLATLDSPRPERLWWLGCAQAVLLAVGLSLIRRPMRYALVALALAAAVVNTTSVSRVRSWLKHGWPGRDAPVITAIDHIADSMTAAGTRSAAIGYDVEFHKFMATLHGAEPRYKVGWELDSLLLERHNLVNTNRCAEGVSPLDQYRVVQRVGGGEPLDRLRIAPVQGMRTIYSNTQYDVMSR